MPVLTFWHLCAKTPTYLIVAAHLEFLCLHMVVGTCVARISCGHPIKLFRDSRNGFWKYFFHVQVIFSQFLKPLLRGTKQKLPTSLGILIAETLCKCCVELWTHYWLMSSGLRPLFVDLDLVHFTATFSWAPEWVQSVWTLLIPHSYLLLECLELAGQ